MKHEKSHHKNKNDLWLSNKRQIDCSGIWTNNLSSNVMVLFIEFFVLRNTIS